MKNTILVILLTVTSASFAKTHNIDVKDVSREPSSIVIPQEPELSDFAPEIVEVQLSKFRDENRRTKFWHDEVLKEIQANNP